jgi:hypothetical protein
MSGQPTVNVYQFGRPFGLWMLISVWNANGSQNFSRALVNVGTIHLLPSIQVRLVANENNLHEVDRMLDHDDPACGSLRTMLDQASNRIAPLLLSWFSAAELPVTVIQLIRPGEGASGFNISVGKTAFQAEMHIVEPLLEGQSCLWKKYWVKEVLGTLFHEWIHYNTFVRRGKINDLLRDEFVAYTGTYCVDEYIEPEGVTREQTFPGLDQFPPAQVLDFAEGGKLPPTIAARFLAHKLWLSESGKAETKSIKERCRVLLEEYPDPRLVLKL